MSKTGAAGTPQRADISKFFESAEDTLAERTSSLLKSGDTKNLALLAAMKSRTPSKKHLEEASLTPEKMNQFLEDTSAAGASPAPQDGSSVTSDDDDDGSRSYTAAAMESRRSSSSGPPTPTSERQAEPAKHLPAISREDSSSHAGDTTETTGLCLCFDFFFVIEAIRLESQKPRGNQELF